MTETETKPPTSTRVLATDVLILEVPQRLSNQEKAKYLEWFLASLKGTSLEGHRVVLLDGGAKLELFRGGEIEET